MPLAESAWMEIEVVRNKPPGVRCNTLVENVMLAIAETIDELNIELTIGITFSKEVKAPALKIDGKTIGEDLSMDDIVNKFSSKDISDIISNIILQKSNL